MKWFLFKNESGDKHIAKIKKGDSFYSWKMLTRWDGKAFWWDDDWFKFDLEDAWENLNESDTFTEITEEEAFVILL